MCKCWVSKPQETRETRAAARKEKSRTSPVSRLQSCAWCYCVSRTFCSTDQEKRETASSLKFMQALTLVVQKLTNAILLMILYPMAGADYLPMDSVTGWVIDYTVTNFIRNRMIRIYEKDVFSFVTRAARKKKNLSTSKCGRTYELLVASTDALPLSYRMLVSAKATKLGSCDKPGALNECFLQNVSFRRANIA